MSKINQQYEKLTFEQEIGRSGDILSGWQCNNPFSTEFISNVRNRSLKMDYRRYVYLDEEDRLLNRISGLHKKLDGVQPESIICGSGSTALLFAFVTHLKNLGIKKIFYVPPIYYTILPALERYGILAEPVSTSQPYELSFKMTLPKRRNSVLFISDPTWYSGTSISNETIKQLIRWQNETSSYIFVDGSMQYLSWSGKVGEDSSMLDPSLTFRLICPSKQLAINGFRFSYLLLPNLHYQKLAWAYANIYGAASVESVAFAYEAIKILSKRKMSTQLVKLAIERHSKLREQKIIESKINPDSGYFVFEKINKVIPKKHIVMNGRFFEQANFPGYTKINLLSPSIRLIFKSS